MSAAADERLVERRLGRSAAQKATAELTQLLATAIRAANSGTMMTGPAGRGDLAVISGLERLIVRPDPAHGDRQLQVHAVLELRGEHAPPKLLSRPSSKADLAEARVAWVRDRLVRLEDQARHLVEALGGAPGHGRVPVGVLTRSVHATAPVDLLGEVAQDDEITRIDAPGLVRFHADSAPVLEGPADWSGRFGARTGGGTIVAVIDGEVAEVPELDGRLARGTNWTQEAWGQPHSHATMVAGLVTTVRGVAPEAAVLNHKVLPRNDAFAVDEFAVESALAAAVESGATVFNCAFGVAQRLDRAARWGRAFADLVAVGVVLIKSAGNDGPGAGSMSAPSDVDGVLVVGAYDPTTTSVATYSGRGPTPGGRETPDLLAPGGSTAAPLAGLATVGGYGYAGYGTSYAAALTSGAAACLMGAADTAITSDDVLAHLVESATRWVDGVPLILA